MKNAYKDGQPSFSRVDAVLGVLRYRQHTEANPHSTWRRREDLGNCFRQTSGQVFCSDAVLGNELNVYDGHGVDGMWPVLPNVRAKLAPAAWRTGQQAQNGPQAQRLMASAPRRWGSA